MLTQVIKKNDLKASWLIGIFSFIVFAVVVALGKIKLDVEVGFDVHIFAFINAVINTAIALVLLLALVAVKRRKFLLHRNLMLVALSLSIVFLLSYITHHLLAGDAKYGDIDLNGTLSAEEKDAAGTLRYIYYAILITHIFLATVILPIILFTAYMGLTAEFELHKKLSRITWPLWFYVAVTGPLVYVLISPYYA